MFDSLAPRFFGAINAVARPLVDRGVGSPLPFGFGLVVLETTGRRTGLPRPVPLLAFRNGDTIDVTTVRSGSQWAANLAADPEPRVRLWGRSRPARASVTPGPVTRARLDLLEEVDR